ncbi:dynein heavy chain, putative [Bodo saltans]|uniref:Dynein heavy chain, putative n=1 Tax=Bodo saltans TaxID=75058 RepID=A0A0S4IS11_BODSA|nr:dynein heavy chain, putative [Bodo saltans]|eukprot:CUF54747.1 dynein heavy chain, putative [Bodo saltans]
MQRNQRSGSITSASGTLQMSPSMGVDSSGGSAAAVGGALEMDKRLLWFEARLSAAFRATSASGTAAASAGSHAIVAAKFAADIRKVFDDDDVRRDITSFCESDVTRMLVAFPHQSAATGGATIKLTASLADPLMHQAAKVLCFRKLVQTLKSPIVAAAAAGTSGGAAAAAAGGPTAGIATGGSQSSLTNNGAPGGAAASPTAAGGGGGAGVANAAAPANNVYKITHDNIHRLVSFIECKPHMLSFMSHFVSDVVMPLSQATVAAPLMPVGTGAATASGTLGRLSVIELESSVAAPPPPAELLPAWGAYVTRPPLPAPVRKCIEVEMESVAQGALVAGGTAEGRTQLPGISPGLLREELAAAAQQVQSPTAADDGNSGGRPRRSIVVTFGNTSSEGGFLGLSPSVSGIHNANQQISVSDAERLAGRWIHQLRETATNTTPVGEHQKQSMASGSAFRFVPISPYDEVAYWRGRVEDLNYLSAQLQGSTFRSVETVLSSAGSLYVENLQAARLEIQDQTREAQIVLRWLTPLLPFFDAISLQSPTHMELVALLKETIFEKIFHLFFIMWAQCPSSVYPSCARLASVIAGLADYVVVHVTHHLSLDMYFLSDPDETRRRIKLAFDVATRFKNAFFTFKNKASRVVHPAHMAEAKGEWQANTQQLFSHLDGFLERCNDILEVLELRQHLEKLTMLNISSVEAEPLRVTVTDVNKRFHGALISFSQHAVDHVSERNDIFDTWMKEKLLATAKEAMQKLGQEILADATNGPFGVNLFRRMHALMPVLQHPHMRSHAFLQQVLSTLWKRWSAEIRQIQKIHVDNEYQTFLVQHVPNATKSLLFSLAVFRRLYELHVVAITLVHEPYVDQESEDLQEALLVYNATCQRVGAAFERCFQKWSSSLGEVISRLNASLLQRHPLSRRYYCSLDHHVRDALRDVAMIVAVMTLPLIKDVFAHLEVPAEAFVIMQLKQDLWSRFTKLHSIVSTYYEHVRSVQPHERGLVEFELGTAEMLCKRAADQLTWEDDGDAIDTFNDEIAAAVKAVGDALDAIRAPIRRVDAAFESLHDAECAFLPLKVSRVGDRTMSVEDFIVRYYENIAGGKRKQALATLVEGQHQVAESLITSLNELKQAYRAPLIEYQSPVVRAYLHFSVTQYWSKLNMFAKESLDNLAHQLDPTWIAQNGGMPLIDAQLVVVEKMIADEPPKRISGGGAGGNGTPSTLAFPAASGGAGASSMNKSLIVSSASTAASTALRQKAMLAASVWTMQRNVAANNGSGNARPHTTSSSATATVSSIPVLAFSPDIHKNLRPIIGRMIDEVLGALKSGITALLQYKGRELPHTNNPQSADVTGPALGFACHSLFYSEKDETLPITDASGKPPPASPHVKLTTEESEQGPFEKTLNNDPQDHSDTDSSHNVSATPGGEGAEIDGHVVVAIPQLAPHQTTPSHRQSTPPPATTPLLSSHPATPSAARRMSTNKLLAAQHSMKIRRMVATFQGLPFDGATYPPMLIVDPVTDLQDQCTLFVESASRKASQPLDQLGSHTFRPKPLDTNVLLTSTSTIAPSQLVEDTTDDGIFSDFTLTKRRRSSGQTSTAVSLAQFVEQVGRSGTPHDALLVQVMSSISFTVDSGVLSATRRLDALLADAVAQASTLTIPMYAFDLLWSPAAAQQLKKLVRDGVQDALPFAAPPSLNVPSFTSPTAASVRRRSLSIATADFVPTNVYGLSVDDLKRELLDARTLTERIPTEIPLMKLICNGWLQVDLRGFKHNMLVQSEALQTFLLDYVRDQTISTIESLEDYVQESGNRLDSVGMLLLDQNSSTSEVGESTVSSIAATGTSVSALGQSNGGGAAANSRHSALREYFELLRLIHRRFEAEKEVFVTLSQGLRLLSGQEHLPKHEVQWLTQRIETLQPAWEALFQRGLAVRAQLASVQDSETAAMRHGAVLLNEKITNHQQHMRSGPLFTPDSLETDHNGRLQEAILWPVVLSAADEAALVGDGEHDDDAAAGDVGSAALDSSLTVVMAAEHAALAALGGMQYIQTDDVYELLNASMAVANAQGEALEEFRMLQDLFEATTAIKLNLVQDAKQELVLVKGVWDLTIHMNHHVAQWMQTTFADVDASSLVEECRRFASAYAAMPVLVRQWPVFKMAEARVAAFTESLPLIHDLKSPALRQRHWLDLSVAALGSAGDHRKEADDDRMSRFSNAVSVFDKGDDDDNLDGMGGGKQPALTGVPSIFIQQQQQQQAAKKSAAPNNTSFNGGEPHHSTQPATLSVLDPTSPAFTLGTLLRLNLHEHSAFVRKLVERAEKELVIERTIARIALFWENAALHFVSASHNVASALAIQQNRRHFDDPTASFMAPLPTTSTGVIMRAPPALQVKSTAPTPSSVHVLGPLDEVVETLDEHLNLLQNMLHSRWVDVFRRAAQSWQLDLQYVESVLSTWVDLQTSLLNLFPIFARSEDLRSTMDEEANAFDAASELFFILCRELYHATNRVGGTTASSATAEEQHATWRCWERIAVHATRKWCIDTLLVNGRVCYCIANTRAQV